MCTVSDFQAALFAAVLKDAITQLHVVGECQTELQTYKIKKDMNIIIDKKYNVQSLKDETELCDAYPKKLDSDDHKINKFINDRASCSKVFSDTYFDLTVNRTYIPLIKYKRLKEKQTEHLAFLTEDKPRNILIRRETVKQLRLQRIRHKNALYDFRSIQDVLWIRTKDAKIKHNVKERYIEHWQESRGEQNLTSIKKNEAQLSESIKWYRQKYDEEQRIHYEFELINNVQVNDTMVKLDAILIQYENDINKMDVRIEKTKSSYHDQMIKRRELEEKFADREIALRDWLQFKKDRENIRVRNMRLNQAAIVVQAWWRGILVRLMLGPFKKKNRMPRRGSKKMYKF